MTPWRKDKKVQYRGTCILRTTLGHLVSAWSVIRRAASLGWDFCPQIGSGTHPKPQCLEHRVQKSEILERTSTCRCWQLSAKLGFRSAGCNTVALGTLFAFLLPQSFSRGRIGNVACLKGCEMCSIVQSVPSPVTMESCLFFQLDKTFLVTR